ncbi:unnamed protein product [Symbiodinium natans]|uniref:EamA domain-containing protein n=1 Tax=Symbiodinium natans TaxID=878477 RepID=A0A812TKK9_9DINO|nr:unnamed protein product [Symbiodinium natans]
MATSDGVAAALAAPIFMVVGFIFWEQHWKGSALELNIFKCSLASLLCAGTIAVSTGLAHLAEASGMALNMLVVSSLIGIVVGDLTWLMALQRIGARRVIVVDCLAPFIGAVLGRIFLDERIASLGYAGMLTTVVGVCLCALEKEADNEDGTDRSAVPDRDVLFSGYMLAFVNVFFDAMGAFLTKKWGGPPLDALDITVIRFGAAAVILLAVYLVMKVPGMISKQESLEDAFLLYDETKPLLEPGKKEGLVPASLLGMTRREWLLVTMGVLLVTCCNPVLYNYALFQIPLAFAITLASFGPIYAIPLVYLMKGEAVTARSATGALMAVAGVVMLAQA